MPPRHPPTPTAEWLARFRADLRAQGFDDEDITPLLPVVLQHLLRTEELITATE